MTSRWIWSRRALVTLAGSVLALSVLTTTLPPLAASAAPQATRGFDVWNLTGSPTTLTEVTGRICSADGGSCQTVNATGDAPPVGAVLQAGEAQHYEVTWHFLSSTYVVATYSNDSTISFKVDGVGAPSLAGFANGVPGFCGPSLRCDFTGTNVTFLDPPGTVHDVPATHGQAQTQVLNELCKKDTAAKCSWQNSHQEFVQGPETIVPPIQRNTTRDDEIYDFSCVNTIGWTDSVGGSVSGTASLKVPFVGEVKAKIEADYHHDITADNQFKAEIHLTIRPGDEGWVTDSAPMARIYGDFKVTMGNTTWNLTGVYVEGPDTSSPPIAGHRDIWTAVTQTPGGPITKAPFTVRSTTSRKLATADSGGGVSICQQSHG